MRVIVGTGWCAHADKSANNPRTSKRCYDDFYLSEVWRPYIQRFIEPVGWFVYESNCETPAFLLGGFRVIRNVNKVETQDHAHDVYSAMVMGAQFALVNGAHFVYIEQDALIYGLDKALDWAKDYNIVYGFGEYSFQPGWAEESFMFINHSYLRSFINSINSMRLFDHKGANPVPEKVFHLLFGKDAAFWEFGYGRKRPIDFDRDVFYAQQLTGEELDEFLRMDDGIRRHSES